MCIHRPNHPKVPNAKPDVAGIIFHSWAKGTDAAGVLKECHQAGASWITLEEVKTQFDAQDKLYTDTQWIYEALRKKAKASGPG